MNTSDEFANKKDEVLLKDFSRKKCKQSFNELYSRYSERIGWFVMRICNHDADLVLDVVQETFLKVYQKANSFKNNSSFSSWLHRIALNTAINSYNKNKKVSSYDNETLSNMLKQESFEVDYIKNEDLLLLRKQISLLPIKLKQVMILKIYDNMKYGDIAKTLEISLRTVKNRISQAITEIQHGFKNDR